MSNAVIVLKTLLQVQVSAPRVPAATHIVSRLARSIDVIKHENARACVLWLVGQYAECHDATPGPPGITEWAPDALRKTIKSFSQEVSMHLYYYISLIVTMKQAPIVKLQVVTLASKLVVLSPEDRTLKLLARYVLNLARYDQNYDVRDRARMMASLLSGVIPQVANGTDAEERGGVVLRSEQVKMVLFDGKSNVADAGLRHKSKFGYLPSHRKLNFVGSDKSTVGSLSAITGKSAFTDSILPDWLEHGVESSLRDSEEDIAPAAPLSSAVQTINRAGASPVILTPISSSGPESSSGTNKGQWTNLDDFYADTEVVQAPESEEDMDEEETDDDAESGSESESETDRDGDDSSTNANGPSVERRLS